MFHKLSTLFGQGITSANIFLVAKGSTGTLMKSEQFILPILPRIGEKYEFGGRVWEVADIKHSDHDILIYVKPVMLIDGYILSRAVIGCHHEYICCISESEYNKTGRVRPWS